MTAARQSGAAAGLKRAAVAAGVGREAVRLELTPAARSPTVASLSIDFVKRDRTARLIRVEHLLSQHPDGLTAKQVADRVGVNVRTAYRDLRALEDELGFPVWEDNGKFGSEAKAFLPPLNLTLA